MKYKAIKRSVIKQNSNLLKQTTSIYPQTKYQLLWTLWEAPINTIHGRTTVSGLKQSWAVWHYSYESLSAVQPRALMSRPPPRRLRRARLGHPGTVPSLLRPLPFVWFLCIYSLDSKALSSAQLIRSRQGSISWNRERYRVYCTAHAWLIYCYDLKSAQWEDT